MQDFLVAYGICTAVTAAILWVAIKIAAWSCEKNTPLNALLFSAVFVGCLMAPFYFKLIALVVFFTVLLRLYDLEVGQSFTVLLFVVALWMFLIGALRDLAGAAVE